MPRPHPAPLAPDPSALIGESRGVVGLRAGAPLWVAAWSSDGWSPTRSRSESGCPDPGRRARSGGHRMLGRSCCRQESHARPDPRHAPPSVCSCVRDLTPRDVHECTFALGFPWPRGSGGAALTGDRVLGFGEARALDLPALVLEVSHQPILGLRPRSACGVRRREGGALSPTGRPRLGATCLDDVLSPSVFSGLGGTAAATACRSPEGSSAGPEPGTRASRRADRPGSRGSRPTRRGRSWRARHRRPSVLR